MRQVRYPLQLSLLYGARAITRSEEAPLVLVLRNVSSLPSVPCTVRLFAAEDLAADVEWRRLPDSDEPEDSPQDLSSPVVFALSAGLLGPGAAVAFRGTVRFSGADTPVYSRAALFSTLVLNHIGSDPVQVCRR